MIFFRSIAEISSEYLSKLFKKDFFYTDNDMWGMIVTEGDIDTHNIYSDVVFAKKLQTDIRHLLLF